MTTTVSPEQLSSLVRSMVAAAIAPLASQIAAIGTGRGTSMLFLGPTTGTVWTNMPAASTLLLGSMASIRPIDLSQYTQVRLVVSTIVAGPTGAKMRLAYSATEPTDINDVASIPATDTEVEDATVTTSSGWQAIPTEARADVYLAIIGSGGDGAIDPSFGVIEAQFR